MKIEEKRLEDIRPYENNPRVNDAAVPAVAESLKKFGWQQPLVIDRNNVIVCGHTRYKAALSLGMTTAPCKYADELSNEEVAAYRLADNKTAELAEWDADKMREELAKISKIDMTAFGFDETEEPEDPDEVIEDEYNETTADIKTQTKRGDRWRLGDHILACGDATKKEDFELLLRGEKPELVFTDPPYGVAIGDKNKFLDKFDRGGRCQTNIEGDAVDEGTLYDMLVTSFRNLKEACAEDCSYYVTAPQGGNLRMMLQMMKDAGLEVRHNLVWVKNRATFSLGRLDYDYRHEPIFYTWGAKHNFYGGYENTVIDDTTDIDKMSKTELKERLRAIQSQGPDSVIYCDKTMVCDLHPTMKPIRLIARFVVNSSRKGDAVADIFGGSGSTMIACEQLHRRCYMLEIDPHYCDVIIDRWQRFTGRKAERADD